NVSTRDLLTFVQAVGVAFEVRVVVAEFLRGIELIDRRAACLAVKQLRDRAVLDAVDGRVARREDVHRFVRTAAAAAALCEHALEVADVRSVDRYAQCASLQLVDRAGGRLRRRRHRRLARGRYGTAAFRSRLVRGLE